MRRLLLAVAAVAGLAFAACGGDDDGPSETLGGITPVGTKDTTPTAPPVDGGNGVPAPVEPELDEQLVEVARGELTATIDAGGSYDLDPETIVIDAGATPACDNLQFDFSWQVTDPYPADGVVLAWQIVRNDAPVNVATGSAGNSAVGCGALHAVNQGAAPFTVAIKYLIGALP